MKIAFSLLLFLSVAAHFVFAQVITFDKAFNDSGKIFDIDQTSDGGYVTVGNNGKGYIKKFNQFGDPVWSKNIMHKLGWDLTSVKQTIDGGFIVCGWDSLAYIAKLDPAGNFTWQKRFGAGNESVGFNSVKEHPDGSFSALGFVKNNSTVDSIYVYLTKVNAAGNPVFSKIYKQTADKNNIGRELTLTTDGGYFIAAESNRKLFLIKTDQQNNIQWTKNYPVAGGFSGKQTTDGGFIIAGKKYPYSWQPNQAIMYKLNTFGDTVWSKTYPGHTINSVIQAADGGYAFTGTIVENAAINNMPTQNLLAIKTDAAGKMRYMRIYGDSVDDAGYKIKQTSDGGYVIAGAKDCNFFVGALPIMWATPNLGLLLKINFTAQDAVLSVKPEIGLDNGFELFPNPAVSQTSIKVSERDFNSIPVLVKITNILGAEVYKERLLAPEIIISREKLIAGFYLVQLLNAETGNLMATKKLIFK